MIDIETKSVAGVRHAEGIQAVHNNLAHEVFNILRRNTTVQQRSHWKEQFDRLSCITNKCIDIEQVTASAIRTIAPFLNNELIITIYPPGKMDQETSRKIHQLQEIVEIPDADKISPNNRSGYLVVDSAEEIRNKCNNKEYWYITLKDNKNTYYGYYAVQIVAGKKLRKFDKGLSAALQEDNLFGKIEKLRCVGINHEISIVIPKNDENQTILYEIKPAVSALFNVLALGIEYHKGATLCLARCRSWNSGIGSHLDSGWEVLNPVLFVYADEIKIDTFGLEIEEKDHLLWNTPTERHFDTAQTLLGLSFNEEFSKTVTNLIVTPPL